MGFVRYIFHTQRRSLKISFKFLQLSMNVAANWICKPIRRGVTLCDRTKLASTTKLNHSTVKTNATKIQSIHLPRVCEFKIRTPQIANMLSRVQIAG